MNNGEVVPLLGEFLKPTAPKGKDAGIMLSIEEIKRRIVPICEKHGILKAVLFGSYARNEATNESDVDFQITLQRGSGLLKLYAINSEFETALGTKVDFITKIPKKRGLLYEKRFRENLEKDGIVLYEGP